MARPEDRNPRDAGRGTPPSFSPAGGGRRPSADGAVPVGPPPERPAAPSRTSGQRPSRPAAPGRPAAGRAERGPGASPAGGPAAFSPGGARPADDAPRPVRVSGRNPDGTPVAGARPDAAPGRPGPARSSVREGSSAVPLGAGDRPARRSAPAGPGSARPAGSTGPAGPGAPDPAAPPAPRRRRRGRVIALVTVLVLLLLVAWPVGLVLWADGKVKHVDALSGAAGTPGTTYLLSGSDSREDGAIEDSETVGARTDTILLLQVPESGPAALISLPRDTYVEIPGQGPSKLNAAYSWGGAPLLVQTVEQLTGLTVDHYVEVGFGGVEQLVDAVGGVDLCLDGSTGITFPVNEPKSGLVWDAPGCKTVDGVQALAFSRMRYADPSGDIGRGMRQRQLISAVASKAEDPSLLLQPGKQVALVDAGTGALTASEGTGVVDLGRLALAFRSASGPDGITGTPPIASMDYRPGGIGSTVLLDPDQTPAFFAGIRDGSLPPGVVGGVPAS
ncbi:LCP family protein [Cellulomonas sp. C5510]|uniref:LCP family protein n=1 Tax=Cellulomonas sp. C5510 TaxID=2871170 RepID=UPI002107E961|nr:LCP family protein [Cellulomonas sp. C5510]